MERFWEAKILDFRIFFDLFGKQISNNVSEAKKIEKFSPARERTTHFGPALRNARPAGERKREGSEALRCRRYRKKLGKYMSTQNFQLLEFVEHAIFAPMDQYESNRIFFH